MVAPQITFPFITSKILTLEKTRPHCIVSFFIFILADGDGGMNAGSCPNRAESSPLDDKSKSLVLVNYFESIPLKQTTCENNSGDLINMLKTCYNAAGNRWANFVAVDYYKVYKVWSLTQHT